MPKKKSESPLPTILVADDDPEILKMVQAALRPVAARLITANDGEQALSAFLVERPQLVVLDVMMPKLSGWEVVRYIREHEAGREVKVLMLTAIGEALNAATSPVMGADDSLDKPFNFEELASRVRALLGLGR
ncbi:MAG TPA: response regulator [Myxococcota bacterium]|nr:response regulator [Myxococcota bacterium]HRY97043.1 response regulator [Myxococcota bacterium]HSA24300.1 response regulator [Myxococcota bacterium]